MFYHLLLLEVDQIFVVLVDLYVGEGSPGVLNLLGCNFFLRLLSDLAATFLVSSPGPLDLDGSDMVHGESMVLEEAPSQRHLVSSLDQTSAEVSHALLLIFRHHVERRGQELLA